MSKDLKAQSDVTKLTISLNRLWEEVRIKGHDNVSMAVLGSDLARIGPASHSNLIKLIVASFILASRESIITKDLTILIKDTNLGKINMLDLNEFLQNF